MRRIGTSNSLAFKGTNISSHTSSIKAKYPDVVIIIDSTEIKMECPSGLENHSACYSYYKSNTTMKGLVGITPAGVCFFVSDLYAVSIFF